MAVYTDDFTGTANTDLDVYDSTWVDIGPNADTLEIDDIGTAVERDTGSGGGGYLYNQTFNSKHYAELEILSDGNIGPFIRAAAGGNFYYCFAGTVGVFNGECVSGSFEDWDGGQSGISTNDVVALYVDATTETTILYKVNDSTIQTYTSKSSLSGGKPGIGLYDSGWGDNWEGGDVGAAESSSVSPSVMLIRSNQIPIHQLQL